MSHVQMVMALELFLSGTQGMRGTTRGGSIPSQSASLVPSLFRETFVKRSDSLVATTRSFRRHSMRSVHPPLPLPSFHHRPARDVTSMYATCVNASSGRWNKLKGTWQDRASAIVIERLSRDAQNRVRNLIDILSQAGRLVSPSLPSPPRPPEIARYVFPDRREREGGGEIRRTILCYSLAGTPGELSKLK